MTDITPELTVVDPEHPSVPDEDDTIEFLDSGAIRFTLDGVKYKWRRPRIRELRRFLEELRGDGGERTPEEQIDDVIAWLGSVFDTLGNKRPEVLEDLPSWCMGGQFTRRCVDHWQALPLARGN